MLRHDISSTGFPNRLDSRYYAVYILDSYRNDKEKHIYNYYYINLILEVMQLTSLTLKSIKTQFTTAKEKFEICKKK